MDSPHGPAYGAGRFTPMIRRHTLLFTVLLALSASATLRAETLGYHEIRTDSKGQIIPWSHDEPGKAYDHVTRLVWNFWATMRADQNGLPYYLNHQVWQENFSDIRGLGGDQLQMAMSSWNLLYLYSGIERVRDNQRLMADYVLTHGMSPANAKWPNLPFPYNTFVYSGIYDGDMILGEGFTQPDKAGSFGLELVHLVRGLNPRRFMPVTTRRYLRSAVAIADTLAQHVQDGDATHSPLPFKVNAFTGEVGRLGTHDPHQKDAAESSYTTNWAGTVELFLELAAMDKGNPALYRASAERIIRWMKAHPMKNNRWGPFFEDIPGWSDTQINAMTWARFIMTHREYFPEWESDVRSIVAWVYRELSEKRWEKYGVTPVHEQTAYRVPGNSHSSRQAADELLLAALTGDHSRKDHAIRQLNWATYMVDHDGKNRYPQDENWLTDGYGDYVRHYLRAMAAFPELAPSGQNHLVSSTVVIQDVAYDGAMRKGLFYRMPFVEEADDSRVMVAYVADLPAGREVMRLAEKPQRVLLDGKPLSATTDANAEGFQWRELPVGGVLTVTRKTAQNVAVMK